MRDPVFILYLMIGPGLWALFALSMLLAWSRMNRLRRPVEALPIPAPSVTILIPAKDEGERVRTCLDTVLAQNYSNFHVIAIDDRSSDQTGAIMDDYAARSPDTMRAMHIPQGGLPAGWLGKCNALQTAASGAAGEWLLFVDSDVKVEPDALCAVLALAVGRGYDVVSIMTRLECETFWERLILPLAAASVGAMCLMSLTNNDNRATAFANGQFFLIRRSAYESVGGHSAVKDHITEDVALMRILKSKGFRTRLFYGRDFASTRMHTTLRQMFNGWARIYSGVSSRRPWRIFGAMFFVGVSGLSAYVATIFGWLGAEIRWLVAGVAHLTLITGVLMYIYRMSGNPRRFAFAFPLGGAMMLAIYAFAVRACRTGKIAWRGTSYHSGSAAPITRA